AAAHAYVRIAHHLVLRRLPILEEEKVEPPHFVRTIIRAVASAHAAVVDHIVQAFAGMIGRAHRTHDFAGRVFAMHARHWLEERLGIVAVALVVGVDTKPVHVAADHALLFTDHSDVVLRLAGQHAIVAAHAGVQINGHAPGIVFFFVGIGLVESQARSRLFFFREAWLLAVFLEGGFADQSTRVAVGRVHRLVALGRGELIGSAGFAYLQTGCERWRRGCAQRIGVETLRGSDAPSAAASI